jgi:hypothetical protein
LPTVVTDLNRRLSDVFVDLPRAEYGMTRGTITNKTGAAVDLSKNELIGYPVKFVTDHYELAIPATDEATVDGLIFDPTEGLELANNAESAREFAIVIRGPGVVNIDNIKSGFTLATLETALEGLNPPLIRHTSESVEEEYTL